MVVWLIIPWSFIEEPPYSYLSVCRKAICEMFYTWIWFISWEDLGAWARNIFFSDCEHLFPYVMLLTIFLITILFTSLKNYISMADMIIFRNISVYIYVIFHHNWHYKLCMWPSVLGCLFTTKAMEIWQIVWDVRS